MEEPTYHCLYLYCNKCGAIEYPEAERTLSADHCPVWSNFGPQKYFDLVELGGGALKPVIVEATCLNDGTTATITST